MPISILMPQSELLYVLFTIQVLQRLDDMVIDKSPDFPKLEHRITFTGTIYSFERELVEIYTDKPAIYLACVRDRRFRLGCNQYKIDKTARKI